MARPMARYARCRARTAARPVRPDRDQLCPNCGYPLMFLRKSSGDDDARRSRSRAARASRTTRPACGRCRSGPQPRTDTRQFPAGTYGAVPAGQLQCPACGYPNEQARVRCERCGYELRQARPHATTLGPQAYQQAPARRGGWGWLIALIVLAVVALVVLGLTLLWLSLN